MPSISSSRRQLGKDGPVVSALGYGMISISAAYGTPPPEEERFKLLDRACELGYTFWDTADIYGDNETVLGKWFQRTGKRDRIFLASKFGLVMDKTEFKGIDSTAGYCKKACEASLKKLGVNHIDLYYAHRLDRDTAVEETVRAMAELQAEGKIKHIGLSGVSSSTLLRASRVARIAAVQIEYSPFDLEIERAEGTHLFQTCRDLGTSIVCYSPLGRGLLTGTITDLASARGPGDLRSVYIPRFSDENLPTNIKLVSQFQALAEEKRCTASQLALAWLMKQGPYVIPIPGTKQIKNLEENWAAACDVELSDEDEADVRKFVESAKLSGHRSPHAYLEYIDTKEEE